MLEGGTETMSNKIDQRIVEMSFENHKFEKGIHQSKNSLKDLQMHYKTWELEKILVVLRTQCNLLPHPFQY